MFLAVANEVQALSMTPIAQDLRIAWRQSTRVSFSFSFYFSLLPVCALFGKGREGGGGVSIFGCRQSMLEQKTESSIFQCQASSSPPPKMSKGKGKRKREDHSVRPSPAPFSGGNAYDIKGRG